MFRYLLIAGVIFCIIAYFPLRRIKNAVSAIKENPQVTQQTQTNWLELFLGDCLPGHEAECRSVEANPLPKLGIAIVLFVIAVVALYGLFWLIGATLRKMDTPR